MASNAQVYATPKGLTLCPLDSIPVGAARGFQLPLADGWFNGFVVRTEAGVIGYIDRCPHIGARLARQPHDYLTPDGTLIACDWHGALFRIGDGKCVGGPCGGRSLDAWPVAVADGEIVTV